MSAIKPEAFSGALALGRGGSAAQFAGFARLADSQYQWLEANFVNTFKGRYADLGSVARARTPDAGYCGSWIVTLGPWAMETTDLLAYKDPVPFAWDIVRLPKASISWGIGGAPFTALVDWPLHGGCLGVSGDFVEVSAAFFCDSAVAPDGNPVLAGQYGQTWNVAAAVSPGQRSSIGAYGNPCFTFPSSDIIPLDGITRSMVYPVPPFAVAVQLVLSDLEFPESAFTPGVMFQFDQLGGTVRADYCQPLTAKDSTNGLFAFPLHPACAAVQWSSGYGETPAARQRVTVRFILDLGAH